MDNALFGPSAVLLALGLHAIKPCSKIVSGILSEITVGS
jgi:hypothetical protein